MGGSNSLYLRTAQLRVPHELPTPVLPHQAREASNLLAAVYGWFTEVFETLNLKEAKAPLEDWRHNSLLDAHE